MIPCYFWAIIAAIGLVLTFIRIPSIRVIKCINKLPGPRGSPIIGNSLTLATLKEHEILDYFKNLMESYKRLMSFWTCGIPHVYLHEPEDLERVLSSSYHIRKGVEYDPLRIWLNEGLLLSDGNKWKGRRKLLTPAFHFQILQDSLQCLNKYSILLAKKLLECEEPINILDYAKKCTIDVLCDVVMGVPMNSESSTGKEYLKAVKRMTELMITRELSFWLYSVPIFHLSPTGFETRKVKSVLQKFTNEVIKQRKSKIFRSDGLSSTPEKGKRRAFLDILLEHSFHHQGNLSLDDIREEVDTFMFEGHDTTSSALNFIFFCLGTYASAQEKVIEELDKIFGSSEREIEMEDLQKMTYLEQFIKEAMRLYPPVPYLSRLLEKDLDLSCNLTLPNGTNVIMIPYLIHRNPSIYPDPEVFDPERFSEEGNLKRHPFAFVPFSAGPRNCIGQKFAMIELKLITANVLRQVRIKSLTLREDFRLMPLLILKSDVPIQIEVIPRCDKLR